MSHTLPTLSSMRVAEVDREFAHWGISPPTGWYVAEKKPYLKELRTASGVVSDLGLTRNLPKVKADLIEYCQSKGMRLTGNETVAQLTRKLKVLATEILGFGKHKNAPFLEIFETDRPYVLPMGGDDRAGARHDSPADASVREVLRLDAGGRKVRPAGARRGGAGRVGPPEPVPHEQGQGQELEASSVAVESPSPTAFGTLIERDVLFTDGERARPESRGRADEPSGPGAPRLPGKSLGGGAPPAAAGPDVERRCAVGELSMKRPRRARIEKVEARHALDCVSHLLDLDLRAHPVPVQVPPVHNHPSDADPLCPRLLSHQGLLRDPPVPEVCALAILPDPPGPEVCVPAVHAEPWQVPLRPRNGVDSVTLTTLTEWLGPQAWKLQASVRLIEIFVGGASTSRECARRGYVAIHLGWPFGQDIYDAPSRRLVLALIDYLTPEDVLVSWPCKFLVVLATSEHGAQRDCVRAGHDRTC